MLFICRQGWSTFARKALSYLFKVLSSEGIIINRNIHVERWTRVPPLSRPPLLPEKRLYWGGVWAHFPNSDWYEYPFVQLYHAV